MFASKQSKSDSKSALKALESMPSKRKAEKEAESKPAKKETKTEQDAEPTSGKGGKGAIAGGGKCSSKRVRTLNEGTVAKGPVIYWYSPPFSCDL